MAILSVNQWRLDQSGAIFDGLNTEGFFDPIIILSKSHAELHESLKRAGYNKSAYVVNLICDRLRNMALKLDIEGRKRFEMLCRDKDKELLRNFLLPVKGVGPQVFENFCILQEI